MTISVQFGTCSDAINVLHKKPTVGTAVSCTVKDGVSVSSPYLTVQASAVSDTANWCEISTFGRKYWIVSVDDLPGDRKGVQCQVDALASFESEIANIPVMVARNEGTAQSYLYDTEIPQESQMYVDFYAFSGSSLPAKTYSDDAMTYLLILK